MAFCFLSGTLEAIIIRENGWALPGLQGFDLRLTINDF
jgi:hypothetical protein